MLEGVGRFNNPSSACRCGVFFKAMSIRSGSKITLLCPLYLTAQTVLITLTGLLVLQDSTLTIFGVLTISCVFRAVRVGLLKHSFVYPYLFILLFCGALLILNIYLISLSSKFIRRLSNKPAALLLAVVASLAAFELPLLGLIGGGDVTSSVDPGILIKYHPGLILIFLFYLLLLLLLLVELLLNEATCLRHL